MKIVMGLDPGASLSKVIVEVEGCKPCLITMSPEVVEVFPTALESYRVIRGELGIPLPEDEAWMEWESKVYVIGTLARDFKGDAGLKELKYERAIYKTAAAVGVAVHKFGMPKTGTVSLTLDLVVLLPWGEYVDRARFQERLEKVLSNYSFRGVQICVKLECFKCRPEGTGLAMLRIKHKGLDWFREHSVSILMFGYRNVTALHFQSGRMASGESPELGFFRLENRIIARVSGQQPLELSRAVFRAYYAMLTSRNGNSKSDVANPIELGDLAVIQALAKSRDAELRAREIKDIVAAQGDARKEYWQELSRWLDNTLPRELDEVIICGGSSIYLKPELESYFGLSQARYKPRKSDAVQDRAKISISWGAETSTQVETSFNLKSERHLEEVLAFRLIDIYGLFWYFNGQEEVIAA